MSYLDSMDHIKIIRIMNYNAPPAFSLTTALRKSIYQMGNGDNVSPGPIYNTAGTMIKQQTAITIGNSNRLPINHGITHTPAPSQYQPKKINNHSPRAVIPKAENVNPQAQAPPCTWYKPSDNLVQKKVPTYSMGQKYSSIMDDVKPIPGPGHYQTARTLQTLTKSKSVSQSKFSKSKRFLQDRNPTPSVGKYNTSGNILTSRTTFPKADLQKVQQKLPGPSDYHIVSEFEHRIEKLPGKTLSMRLKNPQQKQDYTGFAFNKYFESPEKTMLNRRSSQKFTISKSERVLFRQNNLPGPTDYINDSIKPKNSHNATIPKEGINGHKESLPNPGPGAYELATKSEKTYSIGKSKSMANLAQTPGVGRYDMVPKFENKYKSNAFPKGKRTSFVSTNMAGVGDYNIFNADKNAGKIGFSRADRFGKVQKTLPGPGDYHMHSIIGYKQQSKKR